MQDANKITVETVVRAPIEKVWECWTDSKHVTQWNAASDDWHSPSATNDLRAGGEFHYRMAARDGSTGFDFNGTYSEVVPQERIAYAMEGGRKVLVTFAGTADGVKVTETFEMEHENPAEMQRAGWQAILDRFGKHAEGPH
jgi:uncharacterized protein YndB with AHSA1/START domain